MSAKELEQFMLRRQEALEAPSLILAAGRAYTDADTQVKVLTGVSVPEVLCADACVQDCHKEVEEA